MDELREPAEGSRNRKFPSRSSRPPRGASTTRAAPLPTRSAPLPGISNTPADGRHQPHAPVTEQEESCTGTQSHPAPQMQIGLGFWIRTAIDKAVVSGVEISQTDDGRHFCLLYHLKVVWNTHCGSRHLQRTLTQNEFGRLCEWCDSYYGGDEAPPVREVDTGGRSQESTLSARTVRP